jgi:hypothetical protein
VIRVRKAKLSLPWRGVFRGAMVAQDSATLVTGKFDSNWSLYFIGYPTAIGVTLNIAVSILVTREVLRVLEYGWFIAASFGICFALARLDRREKRYISESIVRALDGRLVCE